jgi:hypothetical protein
MEETKPEIVNAYKGEGKSRETREFTKTQWDNMSRDKAGWRPTAPEETAKPEGLNDGTGEEARLLEARERYEALFGRKPHPNTKIETLETQNAAELKRQNEQGNGADGKPKEPANNSGGGVPDGTKPNLGAGDGTADADKANDAVNKATDNASQAGAAA